MVAKRWALAGMLLTVSSLGLAEEWELVLQQSLASEHSQTRQDGFKQVDTSTVKGLRTLWKHLAVRDPYRIDWYVRNLLDEDRILGDALARRGLSSQRLDWARDDVDWARPRCVVFRSMWDYFFRGPEFSAWLDRVGPRTRTDRRFHGHPAP